METTTKKNEMVFVGLLTKQDQAILKINKRIANNFSFKKGKLEIINNIIYKVESVNTLMCVDLPNKKIIFDFFKYVDDDVRVFKWNDKIILKSSENKVVIQPSPFKVNISQLNTKAVSSDDAYIFTKKEITTLAQKEKDEKRPGTIISYFKFRRFKVPRNNKASVKIVISAVKNEDLSAVSFRNVKKCIKNINDDIIIINKGSYYCIYALSDFDTPESNEIYSDIIFTKYSDKAYALFGNCKKFENQLLDIGFKYNESLKYMDYPIGGWIISNRKLVELLNKLK